MLIIKRLYTIVADYSIFGIMTFFVLLLAAEKFNISVHISVYIIGIMIAIISLIEHARVQFVRKHKKEE